MYEEAEKFDEKLVIDGGFHSDLMNTVLDIVKKGCEKPIFALREEFVLLIGNAIFWKKIIAENVELYFYKEGEFKQFGYSKGGRIEDSFPQGYFMGNYKEFLNKLKEIN